MSIQEFIEIDSIYTRSANLERDTKSSAIVNSYIPTSRSLLTLRKVNSVLNEENTPRSWALIGPYGSGKSSFAVFLSHLLDNPGYKSTSDTLKICQRADATIYAQIKNHTKNSKGYLSILLTGTPEPLVQRFVASLRDAAFRFFQSLDGLNKNVLDRLNNAAEKDNTSIQEVLSLVENVRDSVKDVGGKGLLIIFDELGKFLEYEARHYGANDIYLLQALAELAANGQKSNILIFTLMHQGFEQYARGLGEELRNEWKKVQGRFESIPFLETTEQTLHIISKAIINKLPEGKKQIVNTRSKKIASVLAKEKALPKNLEKSTATSLFSDCYPLHPLTALVLPILCQKMAQNERTLFSYLGSKERSGFSDTLAELKTADNWIMPWDIFDYFMLNHPTLLTDPTTHRRWIEVVTAIDRLGDVTLKEVNLLKTVGILNIIGAHGGLKASENILRLCFEQKKDFDKAIQSLVNRSAITFRKFNNEYKVWQGSDFDLDFAVNKELEQIGKYDLPAYINQRKPLHPVVGRRHTIETGTLRYFPIVFTDINSYQKLPSKENSQRIIICLSESNEELEKACQKTITYFGDYDIIAVFSHGSQLRKAVEEVVALQRVEKNCPELQADPISKREYKERLAAALRLEDNLFNDILQSPEKAQWFWKGNKLDVTCKKNLQKELSRILNGIYSLSPYIQNELINRERPSAQAIAARNKLINALVHNEDKHDLGIDKFPAEKGLYRSFLYATGLHQKEKNNDKWKLVPPKKGDSKNFYPVWMEIEQFLENTEKQPRSFAELNTTLKSPPYGIKQGVLPLLYIIIFLYNQENLALYEDGIYTPYISEQHIERFMKRPDFFTVQRIRMHGLRASIFKQYVEVLYGKYDENKATLLSVAKPLAKFISELPEFTKQTKRISNESQRARKAFDLAKSPVDLLFVRLPKACGYPEIEPDESDAQKIEGFAASLVGVIRELRDAYNKMRIDMQTILSQSLLPEKKETLDIKTLRKKASARYEDLLYFTVDTKGLRPFISYIAEDEADDELWLNRILLFLGGRAPEKWTDLERDGAVKKLEELSRRLFDLRLLQNHYLKGKEQFGDDFDVIRLRTMRYGKSEYDKFVKMDAATQNYIQKCKPKFKNLLNELDDFDSRLALLADLVDEFLTIKESQNRDFINSGKEASND